MCNRLNLRKCSMGLLRRLTGGVLVCSMISCVRVVNAQPPLEHDWIHLGLQLAKSSNSTTRDYGWHSVQAGMDQSVNNLTASVVKEILDQASADGSSAAFGALVTLYSLKPELRRDTLITPVPNPIANATFAELAAATAVINANDNLDFDSSGLDGLQLLQSRPATFLYALATASTQRKQELLDKALPQLLIDNQPLETLAGVYASKLPTFAEGGTAADSRIKLLEHLGIPSDSHEPPPAAVNTVVAQAADKLSSELSRSLAFTSLLAGYTLHPVVSNSPAPNRLPVVGLTSSSLNYRIPSNNVDEAEAGKTVANASLDVSTLLGPDAYFKDENQQLRDSYRNKFTINGQEMKCASLKIDQMPPGPYYKGDIGAHRYIGACFESSTISSPATDTPSSVILSLGSAYNIWGQTAPTRILATWEHRWIKWNNVVTGSVSMRVRAGYLPESSTNWIATRPRLTSASTVGWQPSSGFLAQTPVGVEPDTQWQIRSVVPGQPVEFSADITVTPQFVDSPVRRDLIDILELSTANVPPSGLTSPLEIAKLPQNLTAPPSGNAVLRYVTALQESLSTNGWLSPSGHESVMDATLAIARFSQLSTLASMPLDTQINGLPEQQRALIKARQGLLQNALPIIAYRIFQRYEPTIEIETAMMTGTMPRIDDIRRALAQAVTQLDTLSVDQAKLQLQNADHLSQSVGDSLTNQPLELLLAAVVGANRTLNELALDQLQKLKTRCDVLGLIRGPNLEGLQPFQPRPEIVDVCPVARP